MDEEKKTTKKNSGLPESTKLLIAILISGLVFGVLGYCLGRTQLNSPGTSSTAIQSLPDGMSPPPVPPEPSGSAIPADQPTDLPTF